MKTPIFQKALACAALASTLTAACRAQGVDLSSDSRLQKPISLKLKIASLPDALKQLTALGGVKLENVATISDLKVTIFVREVPESVVLSKIASVLGCIWKSDGDLFRLVMDPQERVIRDRYVDAEEAAARKEIETELNSISQLASIDPAAVSAELSQQIAAKSGDKSATVAFDPDRYALLRRAQNPQDVLFGRFLANLDGAKVSAFWRGDVVVGAAPPLAAPPDATNASDSANSAASANGGNPAQVRRQRRPPVSTPMFVQYDPLLYQVHIAQRGGVREFSRRPAQLVTEFAPAGDLAKLPFGKEVLEWDQAVPSDGEFTQLNVAPGERQSANANKRLSAADFLEKAFDETHVPIVADGFRVSTVGVDLNHGAGALGAWLNTLKIENHLFTHFEDGVILVRHGGFWRLRKFETPEETLAPLELKAAKGKPAMADYAAFVAKLTPEQARAMSLPKTAVTKFDTKPIEEALPALQFYASLDSQSVDRAIHGGIAYDQMGSSERQLFAQAALEGIFLGAASSSFSDVLMRLSVSGDARGLGFLMRKDTVDESGLPKEGEALLFGVNLSEASTYKIALSE